jgi:tRNA(Ile)-lysidine synthase
MNHSDRPDIPSPLAIPRDTLALLGGPDAPPVVAGVSGGSDSVALALLLNDARLERAAPPLVLAHLHHGIRGAEADADLEFVHALAGRSGLPLESARVDVPAEARERKIGIELAARECRYEFLESVAEKTGARWVALAHTADDQLETVLHHLMRGAGIHGLAGMPVTRPLRPGCEARIIRPVLAFAKSELVEWLRARREPWRLDHTNLDLVHTRNRIRHRVVPALEEAWPAIREDVTDFARAMRETDDLLRSVALCWCDGHAGFAANAWSIPMLDFAKLDEPVSSYVIRELFARTLGDLLRIDETHVRMTMDLIASGSVGSSIDLPRGLIVCREYERIVFRKKVRKKGTGPFFEPQERVPFGDSEPSAPHKMTELSSMELRVPGTVEWGGWVIEAELLEGERIWRELEDLCGGGVGNPPGDPTERMRVFIRRLRQVDPEGIEYLDFDRVGTHALSVRGRAPGDRFTPLGAPGQTKLKDFLIRRKVPRAERDALPLVTAKGEIVVVATLGVADTVALTERTTHVLKLTAASSSGISQTPRE